MTYNVDEAADYPASTTRTGKNVVEDGAYWYLDDKTGG